MPSNAFGQLFRITTWGESHGPAIGVVIDGCPAGLSLEIADIQQELDRRAPGKSRYTSPRSEKDQASILSGLFEGKTTGAPIAIQIANHDTDSSKYEPIKQLLRPGHANYTYLEKYGVFDYRGGGRASARETACRVAAAAVAKKLLATMGIEVVAYMQQIGTVALAPIMEAVTVDQVTSSLVGCPDPLVSEQMVNALNQAKSEGDSLGGVIAFIARNVPAGFGDPVYEKLEANLAKAMMSIPATKGFEIGSGFAAAAMRGSEHNDRFMEKKGKIATTTNHAGGTLGGISNGQPIVGRVAFKPTSSIKKAQQTVDVSGKEKEFQLPEGSRHDPCVAIRAIPIVEAMLALVLADAYLMNRSSQL